MKKMMIVSGAVLFCYALAAGCGDKSTEENAEAGAVQQREERIAPPEGEEQESPNPQERTQSPGSTEAQSKAETQGNVPGAEGREPVQALTKDSFLDKVFNYEEKDEWEFKGDLPCIIDFYADWCGPCKMVEPILEELAEEYRGKLNIYRVDVDAEQELAGAFGIRSIPSMLFVSLNGKPQMAVGALPKEELEKAINEVLQVE